MRALRWFAALALVVAMAGCTGGNRSGSAPAPSTSVDVTLAAQVPAAVRSAGALTVATDPIYEPSEFRIDDKTVSGFDVDLFNAVAGKLGLKTRWKTVDFDDIIAAVRAGTYQVGVSSFTIRKDREEQVTMVSYFTAGTQWAARPDALVDPENACGKKVAVQSSTVQVTDVGARSIACTAAGKPSIQVDEYAAQADTTAAVASGKDDAMLADSPVCGYAVKQAKGALTLVGRIYQPVRYGYVLPREQADFGSAVARALRQLMAEGTYGEILDKWGVAAGAISDPAVNP
ncbi:MAG: ABC transporter substrate-binding protein [Actinobacteria bacterium 13_2_20CM_2_72_6]|nr:MAG: ABC transporter substrate-binding protein [Actinobacteria bacterium 13_2_20CM_2_72_6]